MNKAFCHKAICKDTSRMCHIKPKTIFATSCKIFSQQVRAGGVLGLKKRKTVVDFGPFFISKDNKFDFPRKRLHEYTLFSNTYSYIL